MPTWPPPRPLSGASDETGHATSDFASSDGHVRVVLLTRAGSSMYLEIVLGSYIAICCPQAVRRTLAEPASDDEPGHATIASLVKEPKPDGLVRDREW